MKLRTINTEQWVTVERGPNKARFLVEPMTPKEALKLIEECQKVEWKRGQKTSETDLYKLKIKRINRVIKAWEGIEDEDGKPIPFNADNLELVYNLNSDVIDEVLDKADELAEFHENKKGEEQKNLKTGPTGTAKKE